MREGRNRHLGAAGPLVPPWGSPLFSMYLVSWRAWSAGTPWISTRTRGSMTAPSLLLATLGSCCPLITCQKGQRPHELGSSRTAGRLLGSRRLPNGGPPIWEQQSPRTLSRLPGVSPQPHTCIVRVMGPGPSQLPGSLGLKRVSSSLMKGGLST